MKNLKNTVQNFHGFQIWSNVVPAGLNDQTSRQPYLIDGEILVNDAMDLSTTYYNGKTLDLYSRDSDGDALHYIQFNPSFNWIHSQNFTPGGSGDIIAAGIRVFFNGSCEAIGAKLFGERDDRTQTYFGPLQGQTNNSLYYIDFASARDVSISDSSDLDNGMWLFGKAGNNTCFTLFVGGNNFISLAIFEDFSSTVEMKGFLSLTPKLNIAAVINSAFSRDIMTPTVERFAADVTAEVDKNISSLYTSR